MPIQPLSAARNLVSRALDISFCDIGNTASMETLEPWDSLGHMRIILEIERSIGIELQTEQILEIETLEDIARLLVVEHSVFTDESEI